VLATIDCSRNIGRPSYCHLLDRVALTATRWPTNSCQTTVQLSDWIFCC